MPDCRKLRAFFLVIWKWKRKWTFLLHQVILELRERPDRAAKARRGLTLTLLPLKGFDFDSLLSPATTPDTHLDGDIRTRAAVPLPGPSLQPTQEKVPRREVFVWQIISLAAVWKGLPHKSSFCAKTPLDFFFYSKIRRVKVKDLNT